MMKTRLLRSLSFLFFIGLAAGALLRPAPVRAGTFTVNASDDIDDGLCDARHCSLREAINRANANAGPDTIEFNIPGPGPHTIRLTDIPLELSDAGTTIAGHSQP